MLSIRSSTASVANPIPLGLPFAGLPDPAERTRTEPLAYVRETVPRPSETDRGDTSWNKLDWPVWGISRSAEMPVLLTGDDWRALQATLSPARAVTVAWDDSTTGPGEAKMYVKESVPVADSRPGLAGDDTQVLYWLTLVDYRSVVASVSYEAATYTDTPPASWGALISDLVLQATGQTLSPTAITALVTAFPPPDAYFSSLRLRGRNVVTLADAACAAVQLRLHVTLAGVVSVQTATSALAALRTPVSDLHQGGYRQQAVARAATLYVTQYDHEGVVTVGTQAVGGGVTGSLDVWLPFGTSGWVAWATQYAAWTDIAMPEMVFAGYVAYPTSAAVDRFVLDHDGGTSAWLDDGPDYPWPLVGTPPPVGPERAINFCAILDTNGCWAGLRVTWQKPDRSITCEDVAACPACDAEPAPAPCP